MSEVFVQAIHDVIGCDWIKIPISLFSCIPLQLIYSVLFVGICPVDDSPNTHSCLINKYSVRFDQSTIVEPAKHFKTSLEVLKSNSTFAEPRYTTSSDLRSCLTSENLPEVDLLILGEFINSSDSFQGPKMQHVEMENYDPMKFVELLSDIQIFPEFCLDDEKERNVLEATCADCAASEGGCKHTVAVLARLYRRSEEPAPTTVQCYCKKPALSSVGTTIKYLTISDMLAGERSKSSGPNKTNEESDNNDFLRRILMMPARRILEVICCDFAVEL
ncbi:hypothetical protein QAD02_013293 [Eretmocerus hayati]|uniref:Uncharacterized protein n=1 Tax=Eretmocerus hayati TaxID=131215 RepID=A0ACC2P373_9HYME|nr:hypothetical protein QAD02_013293 [Eretmocerus hayati]